MNFVDAKSAYEADKASLEARGVILPNVTTYTPTEWKSNFSLALDAQPTLTTDPNGGIPALLTTSIDPAIFEVLFTPNKAAKIAGENKKGTWLDTTMMFPVVEHTGEISSYGDYVENGVTGVNTNFPQRQAYLFQTMKEYGERELELAGLARINFVSEVDKAAATVVSKFLNLTYFFGVSNMQNYGLLNEPNLTASLTPVVKAAGGVKWMVGAAVNATANEIYQDIEALFAQLVIQTGGIVEKEDALVLAMSPTSSVALTATNSFNVNVSDLLKKNFPNLTIETAIQYGASSATNPQGIAGGNYVQLIAKSLEGQDTGFCAFNEKMRAHKIIPNSSSFKQKVTAGSWGFVLRMPLAISSMIGV